MESPWECTCNEVDLPVVSFHLPGDGVSPEINKSRRWDKAENSIGHGGWQEAAKTTRQHEDRDSNPNHGRVYSRSKLVRVSRSSLDEGYFSCCHAEVTTDGPNKLDGSKHQREAESLCVIHVITHSRVIPRGRAGSEQQQSLKSLSQVLPRADRSSYHGTNVRRLNSAGGVG